MANKLFQVKGGFSDGNISYLSGTTAPGGDGSHQDDAAVGSVYENSATGQKYRKVTAGTTAGNWAIAVAPNDAVVKTITQTAHGFVAGDWLVNLAGVYTKAIADTPDNSEVIGMVDSVTDANNFVLISSGFSSVACADEGGSALFLDQTVAGAYTITKPATGLFKGLGLSAEGLIFVSIGLTIDIATDGAPGVPLYIVTNITTVTAVDSFLVDDIGAVAWILEAADDANGKRYIAQVVAGHNGTTAADATVADCQSAFELEFPEGQDIPGLAIGVGVSGVGVDQVLELQVAATSAITLSARRISV